MRTTVDTTPAPSVSHGEAHHTNDEAMRAYLEYLEQSFVSHAGETALIATGYEDAFEEVRDGTRFVPGVE